MAAHTTCRTYYPDLSRQLFEAGDVIVRYDVGTDGAISNVTLAKTSGVDRLDTASLRCVSEHWQDAPAMLNGVPVVSPGHEAMIRFFMQPPSTAADFVQRGVARQSLGERSEAISDFTQAIGLDPTFADAYRWRAAAYQAAGQDDLARLDLDKLKTLPSPPKRDRSRHRPSCPEASMQALRIAALVACLAVMAAPLARADDTAALPALADAQAVLGATVADVQANGVAGIRAHAGGLERALAGAKDAILATRPAQGRITVLTDGPTDTLAALAAAVADKRDAVAVRDPYPAISLYLGSYYNEIGKPRDALRVLDAGLSLYHMKDYISLLGETRPGLLVERTAALTALRRFDDAIARRRRRARRSAAAAGFVPRPSRSQQGLRADRAWPAR